ncbi:hypothetical protein GCM10009862_16000 [Microbacterium binotii]|uniref:Uncharacterized protein n=1 Tax=Microbacterium binotii TaxID=462710 RepID=A0ABN3PG91_9MICO
MLRRRRSTRAKRIERERREVGLFFAHGTFPASAVCCAMCGCGARAFSREAHDTLEDFYEAHAYCEVAS